MKRTCYKCKCEKLITEFNFKNKQKNIRNYACRQCQARIHKIYYEKNKQATINRSRKNGRKRYDLLTTIKEQLECSLCKENNSVCLDFHHLESNEKEFLLSQDGRACSINRLREELQKCAVLCANCHRKVHAGLINVPLVKLDITRLFES